jgi:hypothetical protein
MNIGLFELTLVLASAVTMVAGALAALARRRAATLLALNVTLAACFAYFAAKSLRFGSALGVVLGLVALMHMAVVSAIVGRAARSAPTA